MPKHIPFVLLNLQRILLTNFFKERNIPNIEDRSDDISDIVDDINRKVDMVTCIRAIRRFDKVKTYIPINTQMVPSGAPLNAFVKTIESEFPEYKLVAAGFNYVTSMVDAAFVEVIVDRPTTVSLKDAKDIYDQICLIGKTEVGS